MATLDPRVDAYISRSAEFARPILSHLREVVHQGCPEVEETIKWGMPYFTYHGPLCGMAAFKQHCAFGFWRRAEIGPGGGKAEGAMGGGKAEGAMGQFGKLRHVSDLPPKRKLVGYVRKAAQLNQTGVGGPARPKRGPSPEPAIPAELAAALKRNRRARAVFEGFSPSHRREYIEWIAEAKTDDTRKRRIATALEWMTEGKSRHWKYRG